LIALSTKTLEHSFGFDVGHYLQIDPFDIWSAGI